MGRINGEKHAVPSDIDTLAHGLAMQEGHSVSDYYCTTQNLQNGIFLARCMESISINVNGFLIVKSLHLGDLTHNQCVTVGLTEGTDSILHINRLHQWIQGVDHNRGIWFHLLEKVGSEVISRGLIRGQVCTTTLDLDAISPGQRRNRFRVRVHIDLIDDEMMLFWAHLIAQSISGLP